MSQKVTEEKAREKWCRHAFSANKNDHAAANRSTDNGVFGRAKHGCLGSNCMDWEWFSPPEDKEERVGFCDAEKGL